MDTSKLVPENTEERLIWYGITGTYVFYAIGALYIIAPALAWILLIRLLYHAVQQLSEAHTPPTVSIPVAVWVWIMGMLVMLIALIVGHLSSDLGLAKLIKSSIGWAKGWALLAIFPLIGCLSIRSELIYRASTIVCLQTLLLLPIFVGAYLLHLPPTLYVSPLKLVGGPGPEFFALNLYEIEPGGGARWRFFTPWAPAIGFVANLYFIFALQESQRSWRWIGIVSCLVMIILSKSRLALVVLASVWLMTKLLSRLTQPSTYFMAAAGSAITGFFGVHLVRAAEQFWQAFRSARVDSTRVREALGRIAFERWENEAPIWGHGISEPGPHLVEYMQIGSHHSWYGLLFIKGAVGFFALAIPMLWTFATLLVKTQTSRQASVGLSIVIILFLYTFGENLEILAYLFWPALVVLGISLNEKPNHASCPSVSNPALLAKHRGS